MFFTKGFPVLTGGKASFFIFSGQAIVYVQVRVSLVFLYKQYHAVVKWSEDKVEKRSLFANKRNYRG